MADDRRALLEKYYGPSDYMGNIEAGEPLPASASGSWDEPPPPLPQAPPGPGLLERIRQGWRHEGERLAGMSGAEQAHGLPIVGPGMDTATAYQEGRYPAMFGNALLAGLDASTGVGSKAVHGADALLKAWQAVVKARPDLLTERAAQELQKLLPPSGRFNAYSAPHKKRIAKANQAAERAIPEPAAPGGIGATEAEHRLGTMDRTWPGNALAGTIAAGGASGVPGTLISDAKETLRGPLAAFDQDVRDQHAPASAYRLDDPHIRKIYNDMQRTDDMLAAHIGGGGALSAGAPVAAKYGWRLGSRAMLGMLPLAAEIGMINPIAGLGAAALMAAPAAIPMLPSAAMGIGALKAAGDTGPLYERERFFRDILNPYGRKGEDRFGPEPQARNPREGT